MKKWMLPTVLAYCACTLISVPTFADQDPATLGDSRFESESKPVLGLLPDLGIVTVRKINDGNISVLLELGYKGGLNYAGDVGLPMQIEVTGKEGQIDLTKARIAAFRALDGNMRIGIDGLALTGDFAEFDYAHKQIGDQVVTASTLNIGRLVPVFSLALDSGERVVVKLKADVALGYTFINGRNTELDRANADSSVSSNYGVSAGVELFKTASVDSYYSSSAMWGGDFIRASKNGVRAKLDLPNMKGIGLLNNSLQAYRECDKNSIAGNVTKKCVTGTAVQFGF